jgi:hypothetical protein
MLMKRPMTRPRPVASLALVVAVAAGWGAACASEPGAPSGSGASADAGSPDAATSAALTPVCHYGNPFSSERECKAYTGSAWTADEARADCAKGTYGQPGEFTISGRCEVGPALGECRVTSDYERSFVLHLGGSNRDFCSTTGRACVQFIKGEFVPASTCAGVDIPTDAPTATTFVWPTETCAEPKAGEGPGARDGKVCTWNLISGCTEPGRKYRDYGSCTDVYTNRPYYPVAGEAVLTSDARLQNTSYVAEAAWVKSQVEACACVCCHDDRAPRGSSKWSIDKGPLWIDSMSNTAIAMFAGYVDSSSLGAFDPAENNGFDRLRSAMPSTDPARMVSFFKSEFVRRGLDRAWAEGIRPIGGPLVTQQGFVPATCGAGEGLGADGKLAWAGGGARYLYVLEAGSKNPGIPPNFDMPAGVRWRVDVPHTASPIASGVVYGAVPAGAAQRFPKVGAAAALEAGKTYYLYVLQDVAVPLSRCLFTAL